MDAYNLAICFGPTLMPIPDGQDPVACQAPVNEVVKTIIIHHEVIFPNQRELDGPVYEKCMTGGEEYWWVWSTTHPVGQSCRLYLGSYLPSVRLSVRLVRSDSPHSEPGTIDEADNGTEPHTSDEGQCVVAGIFHFFLLKLPRYDPISLGL